MPRSGFYDHGKYCLRKQYQHLPEFITTAATTATATTATNFTFHRHKRSYFSTKSSNSADKPTTPATTTATAAAATNFQPADIRRPLTKCRDYIAAAVSPAERRSVEFRRRIDSDPPAFVSDGRAEHHPNSSRPDPQVVEHRHHVRRLDQRSNGFERRHHLAG